MNLRIVNGPFLLSMLVALWLQFLPLPAALALVWPMWLALILGYWALYGPNVSVISAAILLGLAADTLHNTPLGQHVVGLTLLVYTIIRLRTTLGLYPIWQGTLLLMPIWALYALLMLVLDGMARHPSESLGRFLSAATSVLCWPLVVATLDALRGNRAHI